MPKIVIKQKDIEWESFRGSGPGGQHKNKTSSCVRYRHIPTGITAESHESRSQAQNRRIAISRLIIKLQNHFSQNDDEKRKSSSSFSNQTRTYWLCGDRRVVDHETGHESKDVNGVLDGDIDAFIMRRLAMNVG